MTDLSSLPRGLDNLAMGPKQNHQLNNQLIFILNQNTSTHNNDTMLHFIAISITTWFILLQYPQQHASIYCKIHHNMVHFTAMSQHASFSTIPITICSILLQHASFYCNINHNMLQLEHSSFHWNKDAIQLRLG